MKAGRWQVSILNGQQRQQGAWLDKHQRKDRILAHCTKSGISIRRAIEAGSHISYTSHHSLRKFFVNLSYIGHYLKNLYHYIYFSTSLCCTKYPFVMEQKLWRDLACTRGEIRQVTQYLARCKLEHNYLWGKDDRCRHMKSLSHAYNYLCKFCHP